MNKPIVIYITGIPGSGKSYLTDKLKCKTFDMDIFRNECLRNNNGVPLVNDCKLNECMLDSVAKTIEKYKMIKYWFLLV